MPGVGGGGTRFAEGDFLEHTISETSLRALHELREQGLLCDAVLRLEDGTSLPVHRALLSASSSYFRAVFTTSLHREEKKDVLLVGIEPEIARALVRYVYLRRVEVTPGNVSRLLLSADYLALLGVRRLCSDFLKGLVRPETVIGILLYARDHFCRDLEKEAMSYVLRNFVEVSQRSPDILELGLEEVRDLVGNDELNVKNEESVWEFLVRWVEREPETRRPHLPQLLGSIRLGLMNEAYFLEKVKEHSYISGNEACRPIIIDTLRFLYDLEMIGQSEGEVATPDIARPRIPHEVLFAIGGWSGGSPTASVETYDTRADRWVRVSEVDPSGPRAYHGTAVIGHEIYVIGGFDGIEYFNSCRCFNAVNKTWREVAPMNCKRCYVSVAVLNDVIYAMGGYDGHHRQNSAEKYDHKTNQWTLFAPMNAQRSDASASTLNGKIYITGGFNGQECLNSAEVYDPELNNWSTIPPMRSRRSGVSCIGYQGCLYVIGGFNGISRMCSGEKFNPSTITWSSIPDMYNPRSNFAIEVIDDMIFTIGGFNGVTTIYHVECYDGKANEWYEATDMNIYRSALSATVMIGLPNFRDYIYPHRDQLMEEKRLKMLGHDGNPAPQHMHQQLQIQETNAGKMNTNRSAVSCSVVKGLTDSSIIADRKMLMLENLGTRLLTGGSGDFGRLAILLEIGEHQSGFEGYLDVPRIVREPHEGSPQVEEELNQGTAKGLSVAIEMGLSEEDERDYTECLVNGEETEEVDIEEEILPTMVIRDHDYPQRLMVEDSDQDTWGQSIFDDNSTGVFEEYEDDEEHDTECLSHGEETELVDIEEGIVPRRDHGYSQQAVEEDSDLDTWGQSIFDDNYFDEYEEDEEDDAVPLVDNEPQNVKPENEHKSTKVAENQFNETPVVITQVANVDTNKSQDAAACSTNV